MEIQLVLCLLCGSCTYFDPSYRLADVNEHDSVPDSGSPPDTPADAGLPVGLVTHVPDDGEFASQEDLLLDQNTTIDTDTMTITVAGQPLITGLQQPAGWPGTRADEIVFDVYAQENDSGSEVAVLHVGDLEVRDGTRVRVVGSRPLVIIASDRIVIDGLVDAAARGAQPGPGGFTPGLGPIQQNGGANGLSWRLHDGGGGGAGHATAGAAGGSPQCGNGCSASGGQGGTEYGRYDDLTVSVLRGGSGGGAGSPGCIENGQRTGGGGGGAVQFHALYSITITKSGRINAGGGGGSGGGMACGINGSAGSGGGSGGIIFLRAPIIEVTGIVAANGGGGGGGGDESTKATGMNGEDGRLSPAPTLGGEGAAPGGTSGGTGGSVDSPAGRPGRGADADMVGAYNTGGGGGAAGYVVLVAWERESTGTISPAPMLSGVGYR